MNERILPLDVLAGRCRSLRAGGARIVLTNGCFDLVHVGHVRLLRRARELGDTLVVALNSDVSVRALKGPSRPIVPERQRAEVVEALAAVDYVTLFDEPAAQRVVALLRPHVYVKGGDYSARGSCLPEVKAVAEYGGMAVFLDYEPGASTTSIVDSILQRQREVLREATPWR